MDNREFIYRINADDIIEFVNDDWISFARENGMAGDPEDVIGTPLRSHIAGEEVRYIYDHICRRVRELGKSEEIPYRCDSPSVRRLLTLRIIPGTNRGLEFHSRIVKEEARERVLLIDSNIERSHELILMCAWCKKVKGSKKWLEIEDAVGHLRLFEEASCPIISHGICHECKKIAFPVV